MLTKAIPVIASVTKQSFTQGRVNAVFVRNKKLPLRANKHTSGKQSPEQAATSAKPPRSDGKPLLLALLPLLLTACASQPSYKPELPAKLWQCEDGSEFISQQRGKHLWLTPPNSSNQIYLPQAKAASGTRFSNQQGSSLWFNNQQARIGLPAKNWHSCQLISEGKAADLASQKPAANNTNLAFTASGDNSHWQFELQGKQAKLITDFGSQTAKFTQVEISATNPVFLEFSALAPNNTLVNFKLENRLCINPYTGEAHPHRFTLNYLGQQYQGCGQSY